MRLFVEEEPIAVEALPSFDGPCLRPGVNVVCQVGIAGQPPANMSVFVDQNGYVTLPMLLQQPIYCDGMTLDDFKAKLVEEYSKYIKQPMVVVTFGSDGSGVSPWGTVKVMGEVGAPGPVNIPQTMDLTVTQAIRAAGGIKPFGDQSSIKVSRCDKNGKRTVFKVNMKEIGEKGRIDKDLVLKPGDVVYVPETWY